MEKITKSWDVLWPLAIKAQRDLLERSPEALPIVRKCVARMTNLDIVASPNPVPVRRGRGRGQKLRELFGFVAPAALFGNWRSPKPVKPRVVFVPLFDRGYCLDVCGLIAKAVLEREGSADIRFVRPLVMDREENLVPAAVGWEDSKAFTERFPNLLIWARAIPAYFAFTRGVKENADQLGLMRQGFGRRWWLVFLFEFIIHYRFVASAATWLRRERISKLVTINDLAGTSAWLFGAAHLLKMDSYLIMHGISGPQNWPFLADECWVWGRRSHEGLQAFGAPASRLEIVGHIEGELSDPEAKGSPPEPGQGRTLLVLSQLCAGAGWKTEVFAEVFEVACEVLAKLDGGWSLLIRTHPSDRREVLDSVRELCARHRIDVTFSRPSSPLDADIARSDFALTVNSTALLSALLNGVPCAQYFPSHFRDRFGDPFLSEELIVTTPDELASSLRRTPAEIADVLEENRQAIFSNRGTCPEVAASRILDHAPSRD